MNRQLKTIFAAFAVSVSMSACALSDLVKVDKPQQGSDIDHDYLDTRVGALSLLRSAQATLQAGISKSSIQVAVFTDELTARPENSADYLTGSISGSANSDPRVEVDISFDLKGIVYRAYSDLQATRARASYARYFLRRQADSTLNYAISAAYSYEGYAIVMMAENMCSGIPLSEAPYGQDASYGKALPSDSLYKVAISKFDSALNLTHDSLRFKTMARVGKARALVALGNYRDAALAVADVQPSDVSSLQYTQTVTPNTTAREPQDAFWTTSVSTLSKTPNIAHEIVNNEGLNGLQWYTSSTVFDPRLPVVTTTGVIRQNKFPNGGITLRLASWIDAKMIEAEYLLNENNPDWINPINLARRTVGLPDTVSPASMTDKVDLLFRERALWFYAHSTRLADMRRLVRQYKRPVNSVFPVGGYLRSNTIYSYGDAVVFIPEAREFSDNYNYSGCIDRNP